jgi:hypothetical protein
MASLHQIHIGAQIMVMQPTESVHSGRLGGASPGPVITTHRGWSPSSSMAIRKAIANQLSNAAKALEKDQTKEQAGRLINGIRISLANVIMPNIPLSK